MSDLLAKIKRLLHPCRHFGHKYPWSAHETKRRENMAAQYVCQRCGAIVTRDPENALFGPNNES